MFMELYDVNTRPKLKERFLHEVVKLHKHRGVGEAPIVLGSFSLAGEIFI